MNVRVKAYAKLNLTLDITGTSNGYHLLDSLVCTVGLYDLIKLNRRADKKITVEMHGLGSELIEPENNNAYLAAKNYQNRFGCGGADIKIYKNIPMGAGMGGSSADAAGVLNGMAKLFGQGSEAQLKELADNLGSDTGYMLSGGFARLTGRGERVERIETQVSLWFLVLFPEAGVSTPQCYKLYDEFMSAPCAASHSSSGQAGTAGREFRCGALNQTASAICSLKNGDFITLGQSLSNALFTPAQKLNPQIGRAFGELKSFSPLGVNMTGSGSAVYALFETKELCEWARSRYKGGLNCAVFNTVVPN